jgi:hypothetical protein
MKPYQCLFNHELLILVTSESPYQSYRENVTIQQIRGCVQELKDTDVDVIMCCPTAWKTPLYPSKIDPRWTVEAPGQVEPLPEADWKYYDKIYWRARRMMLSGLDPVKISVETAHECGKDIFVSYRMNESHLNIFPSAPVHSRFWQENPQFYIHPELVGKASSNDPLNLSYSHEEVRNHFKNVLFELIDHYDFDGLELDFMRSPPYFPADSIEKGIPVMTAFMAEIRERLNQAAKLKGRDLPLCVRVPRTLKLCLETGFDVVEWNRLGLIDMVNVSPHFVNALNCDIEDFKKALPGCRIFGEMHFIYEPGDGPSGGFQRNYMLRKTPDELYKTTALSFFDRGADGVSFFNFAYVREHSFADPRRSRYPGLEPHFHILKGITDTAKLKGEPKCKGRFKSETRGGPIMRHPTG